MTQSPTLAGMMSRFPNRGVVRWMGIRTARKTPLKNCQSVILSPDDGLVGDHYAGRSGKRQVTLISAEHLLAVAGFLNMSQLPDGITRRNIVFSGINPGALKGQTFRLGTAQLCYTDECHPCSRMENDLGAGGYNAMRGHGGICARVVGSGSVSLGDELVVLGSA